MIKYLKRERQDLQEERVVREFLSNHVRTIYNDRASLSGRLALNSLNAANIISTPCNPQGYGKVTFV